MDAGRLKSFFIFLAFFIALAVIFVPGYVKLTSLRKQNQKLAHKIQHLQQANEELERELRLLEGDKEYIEKIAREKLGLTKEGEIIYKIEEE